MNPSHDTRHPDLLEQQLQQVLAELGEGHGDIREAASLAGLLERANPTAATLAAAREALEEAPAEVLLSDPFDAESVAADTLEAEGTEAIADALMALDEVCAGATFLGLTHAVYRVVGRVITAIENEPAVWGPHVELAQRVLASSTPMPEDPALELWQAISVCPDDPASWRARRRAPKAAPANTPPPEHAPAKAPRTLAPAPEPAQRRGGLSMHRSKPVK